MVDSSDDDIVLGQPASNQSSTEATKAVSGIESNEKYDQEMEKPVNKIDALFQHGNRLLTLSSNANLVINDDTRRLLALFSDGRFLVSETHKFDGRVLSFEVLARKKKLTIGKPEYVSQNELNAIYAIGERSQVNIEGDADLDQLQMQKDFVNVVARAASMKVSDIHIVVANSTQIMFRTNGMMTTVMEYNKEWGESFVRAAFASSDISDSNYAQNEFQGAQKLGSTPLRGSKGKLMLPHNVLAIRLQALNKTLEWDGANMCFTNIGDNETIRTVIKDGFKIHDGHPTFDKTWTDPINAKQFAAELVKHNYREGWRLPDMPR